MVRVTKLYECYERRNFSNGYFDLGYMRAYTHDMCVENISGCSQLQAHGMLLKLI